MAKKHWLEPPEWWKKFKPLRWLAIGAMIFFAVSAFYTAKVMIGPSEHPESAKFTDVVADPVEFTAGLRSYQTVSEARDVLEKANAKSKAKLSLSSEHPRHNPKHPPRNLDTIDSEGFVLLGVDGRLTLEFFNNHLFEATFVPSDAEAFSEQLHAADPRLPRQRNNRIEFADGALRIASNVDFAATEVGQNLKTKPFIIWQDTRLLGLRDEWDSRFVISLQPPK